MSASPASQPRRAPPHRRPKLRSPRASRFLRRVHRTLSAWRFIRLRQALPGYALAFLISGVAALVTLLLLWRFPALNLEGVLPIVGIVVVALTWGMGPSLLATGVSTWVLLGVVLSPHFSWQLHDPDAWVDGMVLLVGGVGTSLLASQSARARRRAEALTARLSEAQTSSDLERLRLRALFDALPVPVALVDAQERVLEFNPAVQTFWREAAPPRELADFEKANAWWTATGQPVTPRAWPIARAVLTGERVTNEEIEIETPDGQRRIVLDSATPIRDERGGIRGAVGVFQDLTERKRLEGALRQAEQQAEAGARELEAIFEALTDGLLVYDAEGRILRTNTSASGIFGFETHPEFASLPWQERASCYGSRDAEGQLVPPEGFVLSRLLRGEVFTSAQAADERLQTPDGREVIVSLTGGSLRDARGATSGAVVIAREVTERRRLEREVAERAAQLEAIFESIADGVCVTDRQRRVRHMNQAYRALLGLERDPTGWTFPQLEEVTGFVGYTPVGELLTRGQDPITRVLQGEVLTNEQRVDILLRMRMGREVRLNLSGAPIRDATGQLLGSVLVARDVTEQRRLEQQTRETLEALLAMAEALVQAPLQGSVVGGEAASERYLAARRLAELTRRVLGCEQVSIVAVESGTEAMRPITLVGLTPEQKDAWWSDLEACPCLPERLQPDVVAALETGEPVLLKHRQPSLPLWQRLAPGRTSLLLPMRIGEMLVGLLQVDGGVQGEASAGSYRQALLRAVARLGALVLERERLLREREEARASELALRETQAQMDTFLGMAGHELKTPLTSIKLALQLTERRLQQRVQRQGEIASDIAPFMEQMERAEHQADRLDRLVNDLLNVSRIQAGKLDLRLERHNLAAIVREAVEEQHQADADRSLLLQLPVDRSVLVLADADRISQVVTNYLTNALKYSPADRPVAVGLDLEEHLVRVWVRDEGPGLPPEEQEHIWERFHRAPGIQVQSGTGIGLGLGLHICRTIIERHQGRVGVESAPGQGSTFWFTLPLDRQG